MAPRPGVLHTERVGGVVCDREAIGVSAARSGSRGTVTRATLSRRGMSEYGLPVTGSWSNANYAYPRGAGGDRGKRPSYPINPSHVRAARAFAARKDTAGSLSTVDRALRLRYGSVRNALAAAASSGGGGGGTSRRATPGRGGIVPRRRGTR